MLLPPAFITELSRLANDKVSGATALTLQAIELLLTVSEDRRLLEAGGRALCQAQPSMAGFRTAAALAVAATDPAAELVRLSHRIRRAPASIARLAAPLIGLRVSMDRPLRIVTLSRSSLVEHTLEGLARSGPLVVCCAESRPGAEGRALADSLARKHIDVELYSDAGTGGALITADALVVGADALAQGGFINKVGTAALAALAQAHGIPIIVLAGRERVVPTPVYASLELSDGPADELVASDPVRVRCPYFERVRASGVQVVLETGVISIDEVESAGYWKLEIYECYIRNLYA